MLAHAKDAYTALKAETLKKLVQGDEIVISSMLSKVEKEEVAIVWFTNEATVITNNGQLIQPEDGFHVEPTGRNFAIFAHAKNAEETLQALRNGHYTPKTGGFESEPE